MLGWIAKSSRQMWSKNKRFAYIYGICQSLVSKITATPNEPFYLTVWLVQQPGHFPRCCHCQAANATRLNPEGMK
jgi:hypothetical protein